MKLAQLIIGFWLISSLSSAFAGDKQEYINKPFLPTTEQLAPIKLNTATSVELQSLKGIGLSKAEAIIEYRNLHGKFKKVDELINVKGIGASIVSNNQKILSL